MQSGPLGKLRFDGHLGVEVDVVEKRAVGSGVREEEAVLSHQSREEGMPREGGLGTWI
jgi:hypothetical protein